MRCPRLSVEDKVDLLCMYCAKARPVHRQSVRVSDHELCERHGAFVFKAGKILNGLVDHVIADDDGKIKFISAARRRRLAALPWFGAWVADVEARRRRRPSVDEQVRMMLAGFTEKPRCGDCIVAQAGDGSTHKINGGKLLERIASSWFGDKLVISEESKKLVESSAWGMRWLQESCKRRQAARVRFVEDMCMKRSEPLFAEPYLFS